MSKILLIGDFVSKGKLAGNIIEPVLSYSGHDVFFLPSALISNNFSLGKVTIFDTSEHMKNCLKVWDKLNLNFDIIFIGFINDIRQKEIIFSYIDSLSYKPIVILDPIMGDDGKLYNSVGEEKIDIYKMFLSISDLVLANVTEANFLGLDNYKDLIKDDKKYIFTSLKDEQGFFNLAIDKDINKKYYKRIDHDFAGTGDLLDALFINYYLKTNDFNNAFSSAIDKIYEILSQNKNHYPADVDIHIEKYLYLLDDGGYFAG
ncbi:carbohydrate kinase family protein [Anaerococcus cruorum]|uniref:pyridoxal kinase n=1 Tax=Anaerococcus sp. WGS1529 TaxID=3366812 RepID=UPI00372D18CD